VVIATDGAANVGLGTFYEDAFDEDYNATAFYEEIGDIAA